MEEISQEKALEYMQVAALLALDIDILHDISIQKNGLTLEQLVDQIKHLHKMKEDVINDAKNRKSRYDACCLLFSLTG